MQFVQANFSGEGRIKFEKEFEGSDSDLVSLLKPCLEFNPFFRPSAASLASRECSKEFEAGSPLGESDPLAPGVDSPDSFN